MIPLEALRGCPESFLEDPQGAAAKVGRELRSRIQQAICLRACKSLSVGHHWSDGWRCSGSLVEPARSAVPAELDPEIIGEVAGDDEAKELKENRR